ncbi:MAG: hypothetical protein GXO11_04255 [Epsilonproteobacteria bacterium]|nr:hypothetical protein [Campylobacterota bacterium]
MNKLKTNLLLLLAIIIGMIAIGSFYFFYNEQKKFSKEQKEFLLSLNKIEINEATLVLALLQNYIYAYNNNDDIERPLLALEKSFDELEHSAILAKNNYQSLQKEIHILGKSIDQLFNDTQRFIMLSAAIKNSLIFLASYDNKLSNKHNDPVFIKASKTIESLLYAKRMNDTSFLKKDMYLPLLPSQTQKEKEFIKTFF